VSAEQAVFVDDLPENVAAAAALDIKAVQWRTFQQVRSELEELLPGLRPAELRAR
jgi:FMN phosphatase YigB (HAD superfamily)